MSKRKDSDGNFSLGTWMPLLDAIKRMKQQLTCSHCNGLLEKSALLPCNHIVCSACITCSTGKTCVCSSCKWHFLYQGVKPAKHMDRIVRLYKKIDAAIPANWHQDSDISAPPEQEEAHPRPLFTDEQNSDIRILQQGADGELSQRSDLLTSVSRHTDGINKSKKIKRQLETQSVLKPRYLFGDECAFCHSFGSTEVSGPMMCYIAGKLVPRSRTVESGAILVHQKCAVWAPKVYYEGIALGNLEVELQKSLKSKCSKCGINGATLGCYFKNCRSTFHVPCAITIQECRWDHDNLYMLCPSHTSEQLPSDVIVSRQKAENDSSVEIIEFLGSLGKPTVEDQSFRFEVAACSKKEELSRRPKLLTTSSIHPKKPSSDIAKECSSQSTAGAKISWHLKMQSVPKPRYVFGDECAFCHSFRSTAASGPMMCYINGKLVPRDRATKSDAIFVHQKCALWAPKVYIEGETLTNLEAEIQRSSKLKCRKCGMSGAALGCYFSSCQKSFHVPCAVSILECRWDCDNLCVLCPSHTSEQLPCDAIVPRKEMEDEEASLVETIEFPSSPGKLTAESQNTKSAKTFLGSDILGMDKELLHNFVSLAGEAIAKRWADDITHVIVATDENGACKRTHEVLMAILTGKWILETKWIEACLDAGQLVPEEPYEVSQDAHGFRDGPKKGRLRAMEKARKLFLGMSFCFSKFFTLSYKQSLEELAVVAGGTVFKVESCSRSLHLDSKELAMYFVYNEDPPSEPTAKMEVKIERCREAEEVVLKTGARYIGHISFLDAIVDSNVQLLSWEE